jgi:hypothetical protein
LAHGSRRRGDVTAELKGLGRGLRGWLMLPGDLYTGVTT